MEGSCLDEILSKYPETERLIVNRVYTDLWALPRPLTSHWGNGIIIERIEKKFGKIDVAFGKQDNIPDGIATIDNDKKVNPTFLMDWRKMDFPERHFEFGFWDPPYIAKIDEKGMTHYNRMEDCYKEISRIVNKLAILHPLIYPKPNGFHRIAIIAITYGPNKIIRSLQIFERTDRMQDEIKKSNRWF